MCTCIPFDTSNMHTINSTIFRTWYFRNLRHQTRKIINTWIFTKWRPILECIFWLSSHSERFVSVIEFLGATSLLFFVQLARVPIVVVQGGSNGGDVGSRISEYAWPTWPNERLILVGKYVFNYNTSTCTVQCTMLKLLKQVTIYSIYLRNMTQTVTQAGLSMERGQA